LRSAKCASGVRDVLIYCRDHRSSHHVETSADGWADDVRLSDIEGKFSCTRAVSVARMFGALTPRRCARFGITRKRIINYMGSG